MIAKPLATTPAPPIPPFSESSSKVANRTVHVVTMSKGGVGKSLVAWNLVQYLRERDKTVTAIDLDPVTHSLAEWRALGVHAVDLLTGPDAELNTGALDRLSEDMITAGPGENFVLDNGAAGFVGLTRYLCDNEFPAMLGGHDGTLVIHAVLSGGSASTHCLVGLNTLLEAFDGSAGVKFVVWLNEHAGVFTAQGTWFEDMAIYKDMMKNEKVLGVVRLSRLGKAFLDDFDRMRAELLTYGEAIASPKFLLMNRQRLTVIRRGIWAQLDALGFNG